MYKVIVDTNGCEVCGAGAMWTIEDVDTEVRIGMSFDDEENAEELCECMNTAYIAGRRSTLVECGHIVEDADEQVNVVDRVARLEEIIKALADVRGVEVPEGKHAGCGVAGSNAQVGGGELGPTLSARAAADAKNFFMRRDY